MADPLVLRQRLEIGRVVALRGGVVVHELHEEVALRGAETKHSRNHSGI